MLKRLGTVLGAAALVASFTACGDDDTAAGGTGVGDTGAGDTTGAAAPGDGALADHEVCGLLSPAEVSAAFDMDAEYAEEAMARSDTHCSWRFENEDVFQVETFHLDGGDLDMHVGVIRDDYGQDVREVGDDAYYFVRSMTLSTRHGDGYFDVIVNADPDDVDHDEVSDALQELSELVASRL